MTIPTRTSTQLLRCKVLLWTLFLLFIPQCSWSVQYSTRSTSVAGVQLYHISPVRSDNGVFVALLLLLVAILSFLELDDVVYNVTMAAVCVLAAACSINGILVEFGSWWCALMLLLILIYREKWYKGCPIGVMGIATPTSLLGISLLLTYATKMRYSSFDLASTQEAHYRQSLVAIVFWVIWVPKVAILWL